MLSLEDKRKSLKTFCKTNHAQKDVSTEKTHIRTIKTKDLF